VIAGVVYLQTGWTWIDPLVSIFVSIVIFFSTIGLLRESANLALHAVPKQIDLKIVRAFLLREAGVKDVHDLHVWAMSTTEIALTCHLSTHNPELFFTSGRLQKIADDIEHRFGICHSTIQVDHESAVAHCVKDTLPKDA
jgi:cobalt-zinc-cadmium efflux system protein